MLVDVARGLAITLVVLGHTNQGVMRREWWGSSNLGVRLDMFIYAFHMPAFFFLSGLFVRRSMERRTALRFTLEKVSTLLYPYLLWALLAFAAAAVWGHVRHQPGPSWRDFVPALLTGAESWFLPTLFFVMMLGLACRKLPGWAFFLLALVICYAVPFNGLAFFERGVELIPFFAGGAWLAGRYTAVRRIPSIVALVAAVACFAVIVPATARPHNGATTLYLLLGFAGTTGVLLVSRLLGKGWTARALAWAGSASIGIFLLSGFVQVPVRALLHTSSVLPQLILPTLVAVVVPAWLYHQRKRFHVGWMFEWPY